MKRLVVELAVRKTLELLGLLDSLELRALLPNNDVVDAVIASCREPFYAEASVAPGLGYELNAAIARLQGSVLAITPPRRCPGVNLSTTGKAVRDGKAPLYVDVVVRGDRPYEAGVWFRLVYASALGPPRIRQASLGRTVVVDDDADHHGRRAGLQFYAFLASRSDEPFGLEAVVEGLRATLAAEGITGSAPSSSSSASSSWPS